MTPPGNSSVPQGSDPLAAQVKLFLTVDSVKPDANTLERLRSLGFTLQGTIRDKLIGSAPKSSLQSIRNDPAVREVEVSSPLRPT